MFNCSNAIMEEGGPKVVDVNDLLGSVHITEVATTSAYVEIIEYVLNFSIREATMDKGITTMLLKSIVNKKVMVGLDSECTTDHRE